MNDSTEYGWNREMPLTLLEKVRQDLKTAMLTKDQEARNAMRLIMAEFPKLTVPLTLESGKKTTRLKKPEEITNDEIIGLGDNGQQSAFVVSHLADDIEAGIMPGG